MASSFTNNRQPAHRRLRTRDSTIDSRTANLPVTEAGPSISRQPTPSHSQQPQAIDLFSALIIDRPAAYQTFSNVSFAPCPQPPPKPTSSTGTRKRGSITPFTGTSDHGAPPGSPQSRTSEEEQEIFDSDDTCMLRALKTSMARTSKTPKVRKPRGRPRKTPATKSTGKITDDKAKKRPPPKSTLTRASKIQKTEANSKKKLDGKAAQQTRQSSIRSSTASEEPIEVIDLISDDDISDIEVQGLDIDSDDDEPVRQAINDRLYPKAEATQSLRNPPGPIEPAIPSRSFGDKNSLKSDSPESESDLHPGFPRNALRNELSRVKELEKELQQLRERLAASQAETTKVRGECQMQIRDMELKQVRMDSHKDTDIRNVKRELESTRDKVDFVTRERDQAQINLDNLSRERSDATTKFEEERRLYEKEKKEHQQIVEDIMKSKVETKKPTEEFLVMENARLRQENERLKFAASSTTKNRAPPTPTSPSSSYPPGSIFNTPSFQNRATLSPAPSSNSSSSEEEKKVENIRKTFMAVKKRFDNLHAVSNNIARCTRSMDLSSFGEFGQYVRQLKKVLEDDSNQMRQVIVARGRGDDDDAKCTV
jgi:hypothetical protein